MLSFNLLLLRRWMLSNSTGILDSLEHPYEEDAAAAAADLAGSGSSSTGGALGFLGALFSRQAPELNPAPAAAAAAAAVPEVRQQQQGTHAS
jgi:hypothetical protein